MLARGRWHRPPPARRETRVVALGSVASGMGQTTVAAHLGMAMANLGAQVVSVDLAPGANAASRTLSQLLGIEAPRLGWHALLDQEIHTLDLALTRSSVRNLQVLGAGASRAGRPDAGSAALDSAGRQLLVQQLRGLGADVVILDLGAVSRDDLDAWFTLTDASLLVVAAGRPSLAQALELVSDLERRARAEGAEAASGEQALAARSTRMIGNRVAVAEDVERFHAFARLLREELAIAMPVLGCVLEQERLAAAEAPEPRLPGQIGFDANAQAFLRMAEILLHEELGSYDEPVSSGAEAAVESASDGTVVEAVEEATERSLEATPTPPPTEAPIPTETEAEVTTPTEADAPATAATDPPTAPIIRGVGDAEALLEARLDGHRRKQLRIDVDWVATLDLGDRRLAVRVVDVSMSGAALEVASPLALGATGTLVFEQLARQPAVPVVVKSLRPEVGRSGVAFVGADDLRHALVAAAHEQQAPAHDDAHDEEPTLPLRVPSGG